MNRMATGVDDLFQKGFAVCQLDQQDSELLSQSLQAAYDFFQQDESVKQRDHFAGLHLGYRSGGIEYSATPDRPDLNDSINISAGWRETVPASSSAIDFYRVAERLLAALDRLTQSLLRGVAEQYPDGGEVPETANHSWLQINYYRPFPHQRHVLQDKHEDGHLLTLWHSVKAGLEIFQNDAEVGTPMTVDDEHILAMPGSLLTLLTGGDIPPLHHQVVRARGVNQRMSLMYFVNPTTEKPLYPYKRSGEETLTDIASVGASNPLKYGLPVLKQSGRA